MEGKYAVILTSLLQAFGARLKAVVLFGSRARGEAAPESDHDLFVVIDGLIDEPLARNRQIRGALSDHLADLPDGVNIRGKTPLEFEADLTPLYLDICVDGVCLYGAEYFAPFRRKALAALASSGMRRERIGRSLYWTLPPGAARDWELTWEGYRERP